MAAMEAAADAMLAAASRAFCSSVAVYFQIQVRPASPAPSPTRRISVDSVAAARNCLRAAESADFFFFLSNVFTLGGNFGAENFPPRTSWRLALGKLQGFTFHSGKRQVMSAPGVLQLEDTDTIYTFQVGKNLCILIIYLHRSISSIVLSVSFGQAMSISTFLVLYAWVIDLCLIHLECT
jgi:hypothetical protein